MKLLAAMLGLAALMALGIVLGSPFAPPVAPCMKIEDVWAIEDTRQESEEPLVTALQWNGAPLAYEKETNTFYCSLGLSLDESWPDIHLTAPDAQGVKLAFVDDYTYDWCIDAVRDGYSYQLLTYTEDTFYYTQLIFTGLPLVMIDCAQEITDLDTPMHVAISSADYAPVISTGNVHLRGGSSSSEEKKNLKVEFTRSQSGKRNTVNIPAIGYRSDVLLNPMVFDSSLVRDRLCWDLYAKTLGKDYAGGFDARAMTYAELFINGEYFGVYLMMEPMEEAQELTNTGLSHLLTDSVYRTLPTRFERGRPLLQNPKVPTLSFELRYEPTDAQPFAAMQTYLNLLLEEDDAVFARKAAQCMDIESVVRYEILLQAMGLSDNMRNNVYIWARKNADGMRYQFAPWDMDMSWGNAWGGTDDKFGINLDGWYSFEMLDRIIACNAGGAADLLVTRWQSWRKTIFDMNQIAAMAAQYYMQLQNSGALMRNNLRWGLETNTEAYEFIDFAEMRFAAIDGAVEQIANRGSGFPPFLKNTDPETKFAPIFGL